MAASALTDAVAQQLEKKEEKDQKKAAPEGEGGVIKPKEFFWDQFLKFISSGILFLTVINVSVEFLQGGGVVCFTPSVQEVGSEPNASSVQDFSRDQARFVNSYCARSVPSTEYFPMYVLIHGIFLIAPHYIWSSLFHGDFDSFFDIARSLDRLRDCKTGEYDAKNFDRAKKLEIEYGGKNRRIFYSYIAKLFLQLAACIGSIVFSAGFFINYSYSFKCPENYSPDSIPEDWPLRSRVTCVYTSLRLLGLIRFADYILLLCALGLVLFGLGWCFVRHEVELGYKQIAKFSFQSCLTSDSFVFPPAIEVSSRVLKKSLCTPRGCCCCSLPCSCGEAFKLQISNLFNPRIRNDLDFLLMRLFRADSSHGRVFKDIQVNNELKGLIGRDHQLLHLYLNVQQNIRTQADLAAVSVTTQNEGPHTVEPDDGTIKDLREFFVNAGFSANPEQRAYEYYKPYLGNTEWQRVSGIRDRLYGFVRFAPKDNDLHPRNDLAVDISFGSIGYSLALARPFKRVVSVNFHPFYRDEKESGRRKLFYTNYTTITFPEDIFTWSHDCINKAGEKVCGYILEAERKVDFIVVGPLNEERKKSSVNLLIEMLYTAKLIAKGALLLAIRPLKIAHKKLIGSKAFYKYEPAKKLFDHNYHELKVKGCLSKEVGFSYVDEETEGIAVECDDVNCIFEFITYQFIGTYPSPPLVYASTFELDAEDSAGESCGNIKPEQEPDHSSTSAPAAAPMLEALASFATTLLETCNRQQAQMQPSSSSTGAVPQKQSITQEASASVPATSGTSVTDASKLSKIKMLPSADEFFSASRSTDARRPSEATAATPNQYPSDEENPGTFDTANATRPAEIVSPHRPDNELPSLDSYEGAPVSSNGVVPTARVVSVSEYIPSQFPSASKSTASRNTRPKNVLRVVQSKQQASNGSVAGKPIVTGNDIAQLQQRQQSGSYRSDAPGRTDSTFSPETSQMNFHVDDFPLLVSAPTDTVRSKSQPSRGLDKNRMNGGSVLLSNDTVSQSSTDV